MIKHQFSDWWVMDLDLLNASLIVKWIWQDVNGTRVIGAWNTCKERFVPLHVSQLWICEISDKLLARAWLKQLTNVPFFTRRENDYFGRLSVFVGRFFADLAVEELV